MPNDTSTAVSETIDGVDDWFTVNCSAGVTGSFIRVKGFGEQPLSFAEIVVFEECDNKDNTTGGDQKQIGANEESNKEGQSQSNPDDKEKDRQPIEEQRQCQGVDAKFVKVKAFGETALAFD
jgi:hypothetical protein